MKRVYLLLLVMMSISITNAQSVRDIFAMGGVSLPDFRRPHTHYTPGEKFPAKGYDLSACATFTNVISCELHKFADMDSVYYLKMVTNRMPTKRSGFYYIILVSSDAKIILNNTLNKKIIPEKRLRQRWFKAFMESTSATDLGFKQLNNYWTFYKQQPYFSKNAVSTVRGIAYKPFTFTTARENFYKQRGLDKNGNPQVKMENLMMTYLLIRSMGFTTPNRKYSCNGQVFDNEADMESYKNAQGLK